MIQTDIEYLLEQKMGLSPGMINREMIERAVRERMEICGIQTPDDYLDHLRTHSEEWEEFTELVVIPETWFFRNKEAFDFLAEHVKNEWLPRHGDAALKILSIPCSTGEEPYSIAMTLVTMGIPETQIYIDGVDISYKALHQGEIGLYTENAFRGKDLSFRNRYFECLGTGYVMKPRIRRLVRFIKGNILDDTLLSEEEPYDMVFCRNLLIYFGYSAKNQAVRVIERLLAKDGILFLGHAEYEPFRDLSLSWIPRPRVFAYRRNAVSRPIPPLLRPQPPLVQEIKEAGPKPFKIPDVFKQPPDRTEYEKRPSPAEDDPLRPAQQMADQGRLDEAFKLCQRVIDKHPAHAHAHFLMAMLYHAVGNNMKAQAYLEKVVYLAPDHLDGLEQLALLAEGRGEHEKAGRMRRRAAHVRRREDVR